MTSRVPHPPRRRQADRIAGILLAVLGVVVAAIAVVALRHPNGRQAKAVALGTSTVTATATKTTTRTSSPSRTHTSSSHPRTSSSAASHPIPLVVLNDTSTSGLADTARRRFEAGGWQVTSVGNTTNDILSTCAYYDPTDPANQAAANQLQAQFPAIKRVKEKFPELPPGPIVVVLTTDYS
jgi:hypothetical protein